MSRRSIPLLAALFAALLGPAPPAEAGFPFTDESYADSCIVVCPAGDSLFTVYARRGGSASGDPVWIDFCGCPDVHFAPRDGNEVYSLVDCTASGMPEADGLMEFPFEAGGVCSGAVITISIFIPNNFVRHSVASPDQNGDLVVSDADLDILQPKVGTSDPTADLDCDGAVTATDLAIFNAHFGHRWQGATPARARTWGELKTHYR